jgi:hypothetical protein
MAQPPEIGLRELTCMATAVSLEFSGPFSWLSSDPGTSIFEAPIARMAGIYLWTVDTQDGHLIYDVGETGTEFRQRLRQHLCQQLAGMYHMYDPERFAVGQTYALWRGMYGNDLKPVLPRSWRACPCSHQPWLTSSDSWGSTSHR